MYTLYEHEQISTNHNELIKHIQKSPNLHQFFKANFKGIKTKHYCGFMSVNHDNFYILPKISKDDEIQNLNIFIYMLIYAYDIKLYEEDLSNLKNQKHTIFEVLIQLFAKNLIKEFTKGLYKEYINIQDNLSVLKGKYLINENLKINFTKAKIYCEYDEFSEDNILNQFFLYAIKTLKPYTKNKKLLSECELILDEVSYCHFDINLLKIHFNRLNQRYKKSHDLAMLLLSQAIPSFQKDKQSFAFLFNMNDIFEKFIAKLYKQIDTSTQTQKEFNYNNLKLKPDIITKDMIIDTKYKIAKDKSDISRDDKYQMFVYGTNIGIKNTMLLYPKHKYNIYENLKLGKDEKLINLYMRSVDLDFDGNYKNYMEEIKKRLERMND